MQSNTTQPTHHGYAVNVKDHAIYTAERGSLTDDEVQAIYESVQEMFWMEAGSIAREHGFRDVYSAGRMGGWAVPRPQPATDDMWEHEVEAWVEERFRPFERDILALMSDCVEDFKVELEDAVERAAREPGERAHWEARDVITVES